MEPFIIPFYLGKGTDKKDDSYYFVGTKDGEGRFLKYTRYPFWAGPSNMPPSFTFVDVPESVRKEVEAFAAGKLLIDVIPKSRGKSEKVIKTEAVPLSVLNPEKDEIPNVAIINSNTIPCEVQNIPGKIRIRRKNAAEVSSSKEDNLDSPRHSIPPSSESSGDIEQGCRGNRSTTPISDIRIVRGISDNGYGGSNSKSGSQSNAGSSVAESGTRRVSDIGVLVQGGDDSRSIPLPASDDGANHSIIDGSLIKPKRHRRTKAEMLAARAAEPS